MIKSASLVSADSFMVDMFVDKPRNLTITIYLRALILDSLKLSYLKSQPGLVFHMVSEI